LGLGKRTGLHQLDQSHPPEHSEFCGFPLPTCAHCDSDFSTLSCPVHCILPSNAWFQTWQPIILFRHSRGAPHAVSPSELGVINAQPAGWLCGCVARCLHSGAPHDLRVSQVHTAPACLWRITEGRVQQVSLAQKFYLRNVPSVDKVGGPADGLTCIVTGPTRSLPRRSRLPPASAGHCRPAAPDGSAARAAAASGGRLPPPWCGGGRTVSACCCTSRGRPRGCLALLR